MVIFFLSIHTLSFFCLNVHASITKQNSLSPLSIKREKTPFIDPVFNSQPKMHSAVFLEKIFKNKKLLQILKNENFSLSQIIKSNNFEYSSFFYQQIVHFLIKEDILFISRNENKTNYYGINLSKIYKLFILKRHLIMEQILYNIITEDEESFYLSLQSILQQNNMPKTWNIFAIKLIVKKFQQRNSLNNKELLDLNSYLNQVIAGSSKVFAEGALLLGGTIFYKAKQPKLTSNLLEWQSYYSQMMLLSEKWIKTAKQLLEDPHFLKNLTSSSKKMLHNLENKEDLLLETIITVIFTNPSLIASWPLHDVIKLNTIPIIIKSIAYLKIILKAQLKWFIFVDHIKNSPHLQQIHAEKLTLLENILKNSIPISIIYQQEPSNYNMFFLKNIIIKAGSVPTAA